MEFNTDINSQTEYYWSHGLISDSCYELMNSVCNMSRLWRESRLGSISDDCGKVDDELQAEIPDEYIDYYDVIADVCVSEGTTLFKSQYNPFRARFKMMSSTGSRFVSLEYQSVESITFLIDSQLCFWLCRRVRRM